MVKRKAAARRLAFEQAEARVVLTTWTPIGPAPVENGWNGQAVSGRITGIAADPNDANTVYVSTAGGGIWKTTDAYDANPIWTPLTDNLTDGSGNPLPEFMGAVAETDATSGAHSGSQIVYAGMGESNNSYDSFYGDGILVSTDGGASWTLTNANGAFTGVTISKIVIDPSDSTGATALAAVSDFGVNGSKGHTGIWKTTDYGATWTNLTLNILGSNNPGSDQEEWTDVVVDPKNPNIIFGTQGTYFGGLSTLPAYPFSNWNGVYMSQDGGTTWQLRADDGNIGNLGGRWSLSIYDDGTTKKLYAVADNPTTGEFRTMGLMLDFTLFQAKAPDPPANYMGAPGSGQGAYDNTLAVDPFDPNYVYAAGSDAGGANGNVESFDGGYTWRQITTDSLGNGPHTNSHAATFDANGNLLEANDGGIWRLNNPTDPSTQTWTDINGDLQTQEFTGIAVNPTNGNVYGGSQGNGIEEFSGSTAWTQILGGGDGGYVRIDPTNPNLIYAEAGGSLQLSTDGGATFSPIAAGITSTKSNNYAPYVLDAAGNIYFGSDGLFLSKDHGASWSQIGTTGINNFNPADDNIDAVAVSQTNNNVVYVSVSGDVYVTQNAQAANPLNVTWTSVGLPGGLKAGGGNSIFVDPSDGTGGTAYAVVNSFGAQHVFKTTDFGADWTDISGNLPNTPVWSVTATPGGSSVFVGTDIGVYSSTDGGATWATYGSGLPNAQVVELDYVASQGELVAATHGRGAFSTNPTFSPPTLIIPGSTVTYVAGGGPVSLATGATVINGGSGTSFNGGNLTVQITGNAGANDQISIQQVGGITVSGNTVFFLGTNIGTFSGGKGGTPFVVSITNPLAESTAMAALVRSIVFSNGDITPSTVQRTVQFTISDGSNTSAPVNVLVNVQDSGPVINFGTVTPITYTASSPPMLLAPTATVADQATSNFFGNGGQLDVSITGNADPNDRLSFQVGGPITVSANAVYYLGNDFATFSGGSGASPLVFAFDSSFATTAAVQALVRAITYSNTAVTPSTLIRTVSFALTDSQPLSAPTVTTQVNVQLSVPTITLAGPAPQTFTVHGPPTLIAPAARVTDPVTSLMGGLLSVTLTNNGTASDQLLVLNQGAGAGQIGVSGSTVSYGGLVIGTLTGGQNGNPLRISFTTTDATVAAAQALVQDIAFANLSASPSNLQRTVTLQLVDGQPATSKAVNVQIDVVQVDHAPIIDLNTAAATWTEGAPPVTLAAGATVTYADDTNFNGGSLTVSVPLNGTPADQLSVQSLGGITLSGANVLFNGNVIGTMTGGTNGNPLMVSFTSTNATVAAAQALIQSIGFSNGSIDPSLTPRAVVFVLNDGHGKQSAPATMSVDVSGMDNLPVLVLGPSLPYELDAPPAAIASVATLSDSDTPFFAGGSLVVTESSGSVNDLLVVINQGKGPDQISVVGSNVFDAATLIGTITSFGSSSSPLSISLNGSASVGDVQDLVRAIGFGTTGNAPAQTRSFTFALNDGGGAAAISQSTSVAVNVGKVQPLVVLQPSVNYIVGNPPVTVSPNATVSDPDSLTLNGGSLAVSIMQGVTMNDRLTIQNQGNGLGQVMVSGRNVYYGGIVVGTLNPSGGVGLNPLVVTFNQQSSAAAAQAILSAVQFSTTGPNSAGNRTLQAVVTDDTHLASTAAFEQISVALPANPVTLTLGSASMTYLRGSGPTIIDAGATLADVTATTFARGSLTFEVRGGTKNHVAIASTADIQVRNGKVRFDGMLIGTLAGGTVHLNANATAAAVQALVRAVTFSTNGRVGDRTATFVFRDGHGGAAFASKTIFVS